MLLTSNKSSFFETSLLLIIQHSCGHKCLFTFTYMILWKLAMTHCALVLEIFLSGMPQTKTTTYGGTRTRFFHGNYAKDFYCNTRSKFLLSLWTADLVSWELHCERFNFVISIALRRSLNAAALIYVCHVGRVCNWRKDYSFAVLGKEKIILALINYVWY